MILYNIANLEYDYQNISFSTKAITQFYVEGRDIKMSCNLYNNNGFGCGGCSHFVRTNSVTLTAGVLILNIPDSVLPLDNKEKVCICVAQTLPSTVTSTNTVAITIGASATQYPLRTTCGNNVHADQIRSRKVYHTNVASDVPAFTIKSCELCRTGFNFPVIPVPTP